MTAVEVIDEIEALPTQERVRVMDFIHKMEATQPVPTMDHETFKRAEMQVLEQETEFMQKLGR